MKKTETKAENTNTAAIWYVIAALLFLYIVFLILKINGVGDYTSKYGIEWIANEEGYNSVMLIDGDVETTWGQLENFRPNSNICFKFKESRSVSEVRILNVSGTATVPIGIYMSDDGKNFALCNNTSSAEGDTTIYTFSESRSGVYLLLAYGNTEEGHWPITEVEIYE